MLTAPRWTHIALPVHDLEASLVWYLEHTPLAVAAHHEDADGKNAWLCHPEPTDDPMVLVLVMFNRDRHRRQPTLGPFSHLGIELPRREDVLASAERARRAGCLVWDARDLPPPVGFICAAADPDGNVIEFSHDQGVHRRVRERWADRPPADHARGVALAHVDALNRADVERAVALVADDFVGESVSALGETVRGKEAYRRRLAGFLRDFEGLRYEIEDLIAGDARAAIAYRLSARCLVAGGGRRAIAMRGTLRLELHQGRIARRVDYWDSQQFLEQLRGDRA